MVNLVPTSEFGAPLHGGLPSHSAMPAWVILSSRHVIPWLLAVPLEDSFCHVMSQADRSSVLFFNKT